MLFHPWFFISLSLSPFLYFNIYFFIYLFFRLRLRIAPPLVGWWLLAGTAQPASERSV